MSKEELVHLEGEVVLIAKGGNFRVKLENGHEVLAKLAGKVRRHRIRVVLGDRVTVAVSPYDPTRGFIVDRQRLLDHCTRCVVRAGAPRPGRGDVGRGARACLTDRRRGARGPASPRAG